MTDTGTTTTTTTDDSKPPASGKPTTPPASGGTNGTTTPPAGGGNDDPQALIERLRAENKDAKREAAALRAKASKLDEIEEASKTEQQKALDRAAAAEKTANEATTKLLRYEVAAAKGVPAKLAGRLQGTTKEEMEADADDLLATLTASGGGQQQQRRTAGNAKDEGQAAGGDMSTWIRRQAGSKAS